MSLSKAWSHECLVRKDVDFLNVGTLGPTLKSALQRAQDVLWQWMSDGPGASLAIPSARMYLNMMEEQDKCRGVVAQWMGVNPASVAILGNATDGINAALSTIEWRAGDRIITSNEEHDALSRPLAQLVRRFGVAVDVLSFPATDGEIPNFLERLSAVVSPATRLVAISHVSHVSGIRLPLGNIGTMFHAHPDVWLLVDGSHAAGTVLELVQPRVDFYVFPGHKWLFGPIGTGILWVSERVLQESLPLMSGAPMMSSEGKRYDTNDGAWRYEYGTRDWSKMVGLSRAIQFRQQWAEKKLLEHYESLGRQFTIGFSKTTAAPLVGSAPLFSIPMIRSDDVANVLWEKYRIITKPQAKNMRISLPPWLEPARAVQLGEMVGKAMARVLGS